MAFKAVVRNGRLEIDEAVTLPEGTVLGLVADDGGDDLDEAERALLRRELERCIDEAEQDTGVPADEAFGEIFGNPR